jgi:hypothetical protein
MSIVQNGPLSVQAFPPLWTHYMMIPIAYAYDWLAKSLSASAIPMTSLPSALDFYPSYNIKYVPGMLFNLVVKFPLILSDVLATLLLYKTVEELTKNRRLAEKAALLWFLNPFLIWISAGWGMWDTLPALLSLASFFFLLKKRIEFSSLCLSLAVALKLYPALFLLPITIYFLKTSPPGERRKSCIMFYSVFLAASTMLFLPYIGAAFSFATGFFVPNPTLIANAVANPIVEPVGFGLTYWSLYLLNRLLNIPIDAGFVSFASFTSEVLAVVFLCFAFWKTSKLPFQKPFFDLSAAMLACVLALFLSYRIICEQWFVWALPFLTILCVGGRTKTAFYWGSSLTALVYSVLNCPLPFFFLPLAPWAANSLLEMVYYIWAIEPLRIVLLALLGCLFSLIIVVILLKSASSKSS